MEWLVTSKEQHSCVEMTMAGPGPGDLLAHVLALCTGFLICLTELALQHTHLQGGLQILKTVSLLV